MLTSWDLQTPNHTHTLRQVLHCQRIDTDSVPQGSSQDVARPHTDFEFRDILRLFAQEMVFSSSLLIPGLGLVKFSLLPAR